MNNDVQDSIRIPLLVKKNMVYEYFRSFRDKDITILLNLFADDATIHELFSNINGGLKENVQSNLS